MKNKIYRSSTFSNPFYLWTNGKGKEIKEIRIYEDDTGLIKYKIDWFNETPNSYNSGNLKEIIFNKEIVRKIKEKFDGSIFFIAFKTYDKWEQNKAILYIPLSELNITEHSRTIQENDTYTEDRVVLKCSIRLDKREEVIEKLKGDIQEFYFQVRENERKTKENLRYIRIQELIKNSEFKNCAWEIQSKYRELKELIRQIDGVE